MKKLLTLFLSVMMLATLCFGLTAEAAVNVLPSFNEATWENNVPSYWDTSGASGITITKKAMTETDKAQGVESDYSVSMERNPDVTAPYYALVLKPEYRDILVPGATYTVSFKMKRTGASGGVRLTQFSSTTHNNWNQSMGTNNKTYPDGVYAADAFWYSPESAVTSWMAVETTIKTSKYTDYCWLAFDNYGNVASFEFADFKILGVKHPAFASPVEKGDNIANGAFTDGWTLSEGVAVTDGYVSLTGAQAATYTLPYLGENPAKIYEIEVDVMTTAAANDADGAPKISVDTFVLDELQTNKALGEAFYFDRLLDYDITFTPLVGNGNWEKIIFNWSPPTKYNDKYEIKLTFSSALAGVTVAYKNLSMRSTNNLFANGGFEGIPIKETIAEGKSAVESQIAGILGPEYVNGNTGASLYKPNNVSGFSMGTGNYVLNLSKPAGLYGEQYACLMHQMRFESGKSYRMSVNLKPASHQYPENEELNHMRVYIETLASESNKADLNNVSKTIGAGWLGGIFSSQEATDSIFFTVPTTVTKTDGEEVAWNTKTSKMRIIGPTSGNFYIDDVQVVEYEENVKFYTEDAQKVNSVSEAAGKPVVAYYISDKLSIDTDLTFVLALYEMKDNVPTLVDFTTYTDSSSLRAPIFNTIEIPEDADDGKDYKLSAFCLDSVTGLKALEEKVDLH